MGNLFSYNVKAENQNQEKIFLEISEESKEVSIIETSKKENIKNKYLEKRNIRNVPILTKYQKYAPDIKINYDYESIKKDLCKFKLISQDTGFTSKVNIYEYCGMKIVEKIYINRDPKTSWYVNNDFIKESFFNELNSLITLKNEVNFPKLLYYDTEELKLIMTYNGTKISDKNKNIDLNKIPKDWKLQFYHILRTLKKYDLYHNDITCRNLCIKDNKFYLIDFGNCKKYIDLYYRNYYTDLILTSNNIVDFFNKIDENAFEIRKCQIE